MLPDMVKTACVQTLLLSLCVMSLACVDDSSAAPPPTDPEVVRSALEQLVNDGQLQHASFAIITDGDVGEVGAIGAEPPQSWQAGSISKPVAAFVALEMVRSGDLELDAPLSDYVQDPYLPSETTAEEVAGVTLRTVLTHTSGLPNDPLGEDRELRHAPGTEFLYSGGGFRYLQTALEDVSGEPFDVLAERVALEPLEMDSSRFSMDVEGMSYVLAAASLTSTPDDVARFFIALANPGSSHQETVDLLTQPDRELGPDLCWGHGVGLYDLPDGPRYWHWGSNFDQHHALAVIEADGRRGIVVMATGPGGLQPLAGVVDEALGGPSVGYWQDVPTE